MADKKTGKQAGRIYVGPLGALRGASLICEASHVITLINPQMMAELATPAGILPRRHLRLAMNDIDEPAAGLSLPGEDHMADLLKFALAWDSAASMLIHCYAGISRSTAAAFVVLCALNPQREEQEIARRLRRASPTASPNRRLVRLGDAALGRNGRMLEAVDSIGPGAFAIEGRLFSLSSVFDGGQAVSGA